MIFIILFVAVIAFAAVILPLIMILIILLVAAIVPVILLLINRFDIHFHNAVCRSTVRLDNKTAIITGSNRGLGYETALDFAMRGAIVILACCNEANGLRAQNEIREKSNSHKIFYKHLDLASFKSIREFASEINVTFARIDILVNNAGVMFRPLSYTCEGYELHFGVNYLGHFLLTSLLLDKLKESATSRIVVVSSLAHKFTGRFNINYLLKPSNFICLSGIAYMQTKLANVLFTVELAKRLSGTNVTVNAVHPGTTNTQLFEPFFNKFNFVGVSWISMFLRKLFNHFALDCKAGAQTQIHCAVSEKLDGVTGKYFVNCTEGSLLYNVNYADSLKLWKTTEEMLKAHNN